MSNEPLHAVSDILRQRTKLAGERQLASATVSEIDPRLIDRFVQSTAKRKFAPIYRAILESLEREREVLGRLGLPIEPAYDLLTELSVSPPASVLEDDPLVITKLFEHLSALDATLRTPPPGIEPKDFPYQLVVQFPEDYDFEALGWTDIGDIEDEIAEAIEDANTKHEVDGNSFGAGSTEIFISTVDPLEAFSAIRQLIQKRGGSNDFIAAHRRTRGRKFTVLWPQQYSGVFKL